jgi:coenzyme F420-reducing hydrogenase beta subunit
MCHECERVCPVLELPDIVKRERITYAVRSKDKENIRNSTSGGIFLPLAEWVISNDGIVCAAGYTDTFEVAHMFMDKESVASDNRAVYEKFRGSKYVQSDLNTAFIQIKELLGTGKKVLFIGTPCQVAGLKKYMKKPHEKLLTANLVCHGTPSYKLWNKYINYQKKRFKSDIKSISFRSKIYGYHSGGMMLISFINGRKYCASARTDLMQKSFLSEIASRPSCYQCPFKQLEQCSDLTVYDCWHFEKLVQEVKDDDMGYTNVIVQNEKGERICKQLNVIRFKVDTEKAIALDGIMIRNSAKAHPLREQFYCNMDSISLEEQIQRFIPITGKDRFIEILKQNLYRTGLLQKIRKL